MSESIRKEATITLDGEEVGLRFDFVAVEIIEKETGEPFYSGQAVPDLTGFTAKDTITEAYACAYAYSVRRGKEPRTRQQIAALIGVYNVIDLRVVLHELAKRNFPDAPQEAPAEEEQEARPQTAPLA